MSLVRALLTESYGMENTDYGYDFTEEAVMDTYYTDAAIESLVADIYSANRALKTADVMGEVQVIKEGADPAVLLEGIIASGFQKLKEAFKKFIAKIKAWAAKVKRFFKVLFSKGKDLAKNYRREFMDKDSKNFKYKGFPYKIEQGDGKVQSISDSVTKVIEDLTGKVADAASLSEDQLKADYMGNAQKGKDAKTSKFPKITAGGIEIDPNTQSSSDVQDKITKSVSKADDLSEMGTELEELYRGGETEKIEIEDFEANSKDQMIKFLENDKAVRDIEKAEREFEKDVNAIIKALDKAAKETKDDGNGGKTDAYPLASKISSYVSAALAVRKKAVDVKVAIYKEAYNAFTSVVRSFLLVRVKESALDEFNGLIALTEADAAAEPEMDEDMEDDNSSSTKEGCGKKKACESLFEQAYNYL